MSFRLLDVDQWERKEYYRHYLKDVPCSYSLTVEVDITALAGYRLYPAMLWLLISTANEMEEFRTALLPEGVGVFDSMHPSYTVLNPETGRFCYGWTPYQRNPEEFMKRCGEDIEQFRKAETMMPCPDMPPNVLNISMIPWVSFTAFHLNLHHGDQYLLPIFTLGKYQEKDGRRMLPLAIQVHHAVCDGYHIALFMEKLQQKTAAFPAGTPGCKRKNS